MGFLSKAFKSVKKAVKKVARGIKKFGSKVWSGIKKGIGKVGEWFGKLGPLGTIALSFVMPGIGNMLAGMWSSAAGSLASGQFGTILQAVGKGMEVAAQAGSKAIGFVKDLASPITSKMQAGLEWVGGKVSDGANALFKGAQQAAGVKNPASIGDLGKWVTDKAKSFVGKAPTEGAQLATADMDLARQAVQANPEFAKMSAFQGGTAEELAIRQGSFLGSGMDAQQVTAAAIQENPELVKMANFGGVDQSTLVTEGMKETAEANLGLEALATKPAATEATDQSLLKKIAKSAASAFGGAPGMVQSTLPQFTTGETPDLTLSSRFGVGGQGSAGGQFLSDAQRQQQALMAQILGQVG